MITGVHTMFYSSEADALRAFLRDKLGFTANDVGEGWLIFDLPSADMGVHPTDPDGGGPTNGAHDISFYCEDLNATIAELKAKDVEFVGGVEDQGWGLITHFMMPGAVKAMLYEPRYKKG